MSATKTKALVVVCLCIALTAIWFAIPSRNLLSSPDSATPEAKRILESQIDKPDSAHNPETYDESRTSKSIARKHAQSLHDQKGKSQEIDERLAHAYLRLGSPYPFKWRESAYIAGEHGDPDEATEAIIDLIQNRETQTVENRKSFEGKPQRYIASKQGGAYMERLRVLPALGLTGTKRAEEFLLNAYKNPHDVSANSELRQMDRASGYRVPSDSVIDNLTWSKALTGLIMLDEEKYSPVLEEDFYRTLPETRRSSSTENPRAAWEDLRQEPRLGMLLDILVRRDVIRERGTENAVYMLDYEAFLNEWDKYSHRYVTFPPGSAAAEAGELGN